MKRLLATAMMATGAALSAGLAGVAPAHAADFTYEFKANTGYSAEGTFSYNNTSPSGIIAEEGAGPTNFLTSISLSVFDPSHNLLASGSSVVNGISNDSFFKFNFDSNTKQLAVLDTSTSAVDNYFVSNAVDTSGQPVTPGSTSFKLFKFTTSTQAYTFLGSASSIEVKPTAVPEPSSMLDTFVAVGLGAGLLLRRKLKASV